jgi:hypothetical protein
MSLPPVPDQSSIVPEQPLGVRVTLGRCMFSLIFSALWILGSSAYTIVCLREGNKLQALMFTAVVVAQALTLPAGWKQYRLVSSGAVIYIRRNGLRMPTAVSVVVTGILTLLVSLVTVACAMIINTPVFRHNPMPTLAIMLVVNGLLWAYVAYCWYRISQERQRSKPQEIVSVPTEGVWPPPPTHRT